MKISKSINDMKTFEDFNNMEELFLGIAHLDDLEIKFDFIDYGADFFYYYNDSWLFKENKKNEFFFINYDKIWSVFEKKYGLNYDEIDNFMTIMLDKYFKLKYNVTYVD